MENDREAEEAAPSRQLNWPLIAGIFLVATITFLAIVGPTIAPKDPAEENNITMIEGEWYIPPFDIGTPGYPLGSDSFGRDLYSRLLWGIRPTMIMVFVVAVAMLRTGTAGASDPFKCYKAKDLKLDRFVALKFLPQDMTRDDEAKGAPWGLVIMSRW